MPLSLVAAPDAEPITLSAAKAQLKLEVADDDALVTGLITAVRERAEALTRRAFLTQTWDLMLSAFPACRAIELPKPPLVRVVSVTYVDTTGATVTLSPSSYQVQAPAGPRCRRGRLVLAADASWPATADVVDAVTIRFEAGYGAVPDASVPALIRAAMVMDLATLYEQRQSVTTGGVSEVPWGAREIYRLHRSHGLLPCEA